MADRVSIAILRANALKSILTESTAIAETLGIPPPVFTERNRDPDYLQAVQLKQVAEFLGVVSESVAPKQKAKTK